MVTVQDVLRRKGRAVVSVERSATVVNAARRMNEGKIGSVVVADGERVIGIFTERDVLNRIVAAGRDPASCTVGEVMTTPVACCTSGTSLDECRRVMRERRIRHLPVVDEGHLSGLISIGDLNTFEADGQAETIRYLSDYMFRRQ